jgi:hypothetical protein
MSGPNMSQLRIFWELVQRAIQRQMTYRAASIAGLATNFFFGLLRAAVLVALYGARQQVEGMSVQDAITYTGLTQAIIRLLDNGEAQLTAPLHGLAPEGYRRLQALLPSFEGACRRLAAFGIPTSLHHDDLHDANIFLHEGKYRFADWGESCVTHPFFSLLVNLRSAAYRFGLDEQAAQIWRIRDAYLQAWTDFAQLEDLREAFALATRLAMVNRALTWQRVVSTIPPDERQKYEEAVPGWLQVFLDAS